MAEEKPDPAETDPPAGPEQTPPAATPPAEAKKRTPAFRRSLLARLPQLGYSAWTVKDSFRLDDEWSSVVNVKADAVLEPLEAVAPNRHDAQEPPRSGRE